MSVPPRAGTSRTNGSSQGGGDCLQDSVGAYCPCHIAPTGVGSRFTWNQPTRSRRHSHVPMSRGATYGSRWGVRRKASYAQMRISTAIEAGTTGDSYKEAPPRPPSRLPTNTIRPPCAAGVPPICAALEVDATRREASFHVKQVGPSTAACSNEKDRTTQRVIRPRLERLIGTARIPAPAPASASHRWRLQLLRRP
jgi:hypothetical protein